MMNYLNRNYDIMAFILNAFTISIKILTSLAKAVLKNLRVFLDRINKSCYHKSSLDKLPFILSMIIRSLFNQINDSLFKENVALIFGTRRVGKTTLLRELVKYHESMQRKCSYLDCESIVARQKIDTLNDYELKGIVEGIDILAIDEAQNIETIGKTLKILHDTFPHVQVIATGSSSFDLANKTGEPLVGRMRQFLLYPFSVREIWNQEGIVEATAGIDTFLKYGLYPKVYKANTEDARAELEMLVSGYLYKDLLTFDGIKNSKQILTLLQCLALQVGSEVSFNELSGKLNMSLPTVKKYIDLLEKCYIIFTLPALSRNMRNEIAGNRTRKIYFYDVGIRNALINNYADLNLRSDAGGIWENFCIVELKKKAQREGRHPLLYFWKTVNQKEIDLLEEEDGAFNVYEFKLNDSKKAKLPKGFDEHYNVRSFNVITKDNWHKFF